VKNTQAAVLPELEAQIGVNLSRILADAGYKGHNAPDHLRLKVFTSGQKRGVTDQIKRQLRRRAAVEPVIGHLKAEHRMGRNYLAHRSGDAANAVLAGAGYNFRLLILWLRLLLAKILAAFIVAYRPPSTLANT
jgi:IS5 family transposase